MKDYDVWMTRLCIVVTMLAAVFTLSIVVDIRKQGAETPAYVATAHAAPVAETGVIHYEDEADVKLMREKSIHEIGAEIDRVKTRIEALERELTYQPMGSENDEHMR